MASFSFRINLLLTLLLMPVLSPAMPVNLHFDPPDEVSFTTLRLVGSFNGWNNADNNLVMTDSDGDGEYSISVDLVLDVAHNYKFCMDADWGMAFNDPDNPDINTSDNYNSIITPTDPMITYLLPRTINSLGETYYDVSDNGEPIRVIIDYSPANPIDLNSLEVTYDGNPIANPGQYYDAAAHEFRYEFPETPSVGSHTITASITSTAGTATRSATYTYDPSMVVIEIPVDFYFDSHSSRVQDIFVQNVNSVSLMGPFNGWNNQFDPLQDNDGDGVWEITAELEENAWEYKFQLNGSFWINDWDYPHFNPNNADNNWIVVEGSDAPTIKLIEPAQGTIFPETQTSMTIHAKLRPGYDGQGVDETSIHVRYWGNDVSHQFDEASSSVSAEIIFGTDPIALVEVEFANNLGISIVETFTFGVYAEDSGFHCIDTRNDCRYTPPGDISASSLDIYSFHIAATGNNDILDFSIELAEIDDRTRVGLLIANPSDDHVTDPLGLDLLLGEWNDEGVFIALAPPTSALFDPLVENRFMELRDPMTFGNYTVNLDEDAINAGYFNFQIELAYLDSLLGGWNQERDFVCFSYLADESGSGLGYEVSAVDGGVDSVEDPDIFDAIFVRDAFWQDRILANYIIDGEAHGPLLSGLDGIGRGVARLVAEDISDDLATFGPVISFLTPPVTYWYDDLTIYGSIDDPAVTTVTFYFNGEAHEIPVSGGLFSLDVTLLEGDNEVYVYAIGSNGFATTTDTEIYSYAYDHTPTIYIAGEVNGRQVSLYALGNSPDGLGFSYIWSADYDNPSEIFSFAFQQTISINVPDNAPYGEYYFNAVATDTQNRSITGRCYLIVDENGVRLNENNDHAAWIDEAIVYEIYPRSFTEQGGFTGVMDRIPDMVDLGINTVWFMPIYAGPTVHGYEITDYYGFEEDYGTAAEFEDMVEELHDNGIRVILDFVVNHTSIQHEFMQNVFQYYQYSPWADFYLWDGVPGDSNYEYYFDWASLPNLNHNNLEVREYFIDVAEHWVREYGIDGFRCDVAWGVEERNTQFWQEWRERLKLAKPEVFLEAEASSSDPVFYQNRFDSANDWDLRNRIINCINGTSSINELDAELRRSYPAHARPFRFLENHDEVRMAASHDTQRSKLAHTIIMTANGVPLIYSGGEVGELTGRDLIDWSDPNNVRPYFKRLVEIRQNYIRNPVINRVTNSAASDIYTYISASGDHVVLTAANFSDELLNFTMDLSGLPFDGAGPYYLSDLISGEVMEIAANQLSAYPLSVEGYTARVLYYGPQALAIEDEPEIESGFHLAPNYPNPFNPATVIGFRLPAVAHVDLSVYNSCGQRVKTLARNPLSSGYHEITWDGTNEAGQAVGSGIYFYRLKTDDGYEASRSMVLLK